MTGKRTSYLVFNDDGSTTVTTTGASGNQEVDKKATADVNTLNKNRQQAELDYQNYRDSRPSSPADEAWKENYIQRRTELYNQGKIKTPGGANVSAGAKGSGSGSGTGSGGASTKPVEIDFKGAPKPTDEKQPQLENDVSQRPRFTSSGQVRSQSFNINSFRSELLENDVLSTHSYLVTFSPFRAGFKENAPLTRFVTNRRNTLILRCENIVLPTSSLLEEENIRRYGYGPVEKVPYGVQFSDVTMTWLVDKNSELIEFFNQWMNTIVMHDSPNTLMKGGIPRPGLEAYDPFEIGYKDAYTNPIVRISVYNKQDETTTTYEMYDVFPMNIQAMNLSWADENEVQKLTITFAYTNMKVRAPRARDDILQENFVATNRPPPLMERLERLNDSGGRAAADTVGSPTNESTRRTAGASTPNATSAPAPAPTAARPIPAGPATRTFVGPPAP
jgi:hypothetical protein